MRTAFRSLLDAARHEARHQLSGGDVIRGPDLEPVRCWRAEAAIAIGARDLGVRPGRARPEVEAEELAAVRPAAALRGGRQYVVSGEDCGLEGRLAFCGAWRQATRDDLHSVALDGARLALIHEVARLEIVRGSEAPSVPLPTDHRDARAARRHLHVPRLPVLLQEGLPGDGLHLGELAQGLSERPEAQAPDAASARGRLARTAVDALVAAVPVKAVVVAGELGACLDVSGRIGGVLAAEPVRVEADVFCWVEHVRVAAVVRKTVKVACLPHSVFEEWKVRVDIKHKFTPVSSEQDLPRFVSDQVKLRLEDHLACRHGLSGEQPLAVCDVSWLHVLRDLAREHL
mmetsp:Transcript_66003/g.187445  ORF Transcript_66003/g.187445 Transcript_66003/m.187445 type:complete len:344 (-) Transcript_66003:44-1075(-)